MAVAPGGRPPRRGVGCLLPLGAMVVGAGLVLTLAVVSRHPDGTARSDPETAVLDDPAARVLPMTGTLRGVAVVLSPGSGDAVVLGSDIAELEPDRTYQLWWRKGEETGSVGLFRPSVDGVVDVLFDDVVTGDDVTYLVTIEPVEGSRVMTGPVVATSAVSAGDSLP